MRVANFQFLFTSNWTDVTNEVTGVCMLFVHSLYSNFNNILYSFIRLVVSAAEQFCLSWRIYNGTQLSCLVTSNCWTKLFFDIEMYFLLCLHKLTSTQNSSLQQVLSRKKLLLITRLIINTMLKNFVSYHIFLPDTSRSVVESLRSHV